MSPSPPDLVALTCTSCGSGLEILSDACVFPCRRCGLAYLPSETGLIEIEPGTAAVTSEHTVPREVRYLAFWRFPAAVEVRRKSCSAGGPPGLVWEHVRRAGAPDPPFVYVPAFTLTRITVQQLGVGLVQAQPKLILEAGLPSNGPVPPRLHGTTPFEEGWSGPGFATLSPVVFTEEDARAGAHFVYLAVEARHTPDLTAIDYELDLGSGELLFLPAAYDLRHVRDSNWRLLLREFDGLVA